MYEIAKRDPSPRLRGRSRFGAVKARLSALPLRRRGSAASRKGRGGIFARLEL